MVKVEVVVHPQGLGPTEAAKAWYMRVVEKMKWTDIQKKVKTVQGKTPQSEHCVKNAVQRVTARSMEDGRQVCAHRAGQQRAEEREHSSSCTWA